MMTKPLIYDYTLEKLEEWLKDNNEPKFRAKQIFDWLYVKRVSSFSEMSNLSKGLIEKLINFFAIYSLQEVKQQVSQDGTIKLLYQLIDGNSIETVLMRHSYGNSVCVTTQVGCRMGCTFCASTLGGLVRNLTAGEIVLQILEIQRILDLTKERVSHIVIMGSGEPFENFEATIDFIKVVNAEIGFKIGQRHITVSTSGIIPNIYRFADLGLQVSLAVSLHAPNQELRAQLMPISRKYPLDQLLAACYYYINKTNRRITFEYALIGNVNDKLEHAEELANILKGMLCHVNLIPVNYVPERNFARTSRNQIFRFHDILANNGINVTIRREQGGDIAAACGQLRHQYLNADFKLR